MIIKTGQSPVTSTNSGTQTDLCGLDHFLKKDISNDIKSEMVVMATKQVYESGLKSLKANQLLSETQKLNGKNFTWKDLALIIMTVSVSKICAFIIVHANNGHAEEGAVKELLQKGENLQQRVPDERKREEIRIKQHLLNSKYNTVKDLRSLRKKKALPISPQWYQYRRQTDNLLQWLDDIEKRVASLPDPRDEQKIKQTVYEETTVVTTEGVTVETSHVPSAYLAEIRCLLHSIAEVEFLLNSPEYWAGNFHNFSNQEDCLKNVKYNLGQLSSRVEGVHSKRAAALQSASPVETEQIQEALTQLDVNWEKLNKLYKDRHA
ncbi:UNVERIFIED_CONTAM: hypothetical protein FKN15_029458 [Acipenser sinensis]